jgi:arginyl-tRNA--protein-N-Asp/Glu arginylyltransferase
MTSQTFKLPRHFYRMPPRPCPYLPGRTEQNVFTELSGSDGVALYDILTHAGFRRSHNIAYRPTCPGCNACVSVRVVARDFKASRSQRRVLNINCDLRSGERPPVASEEHYGLFARYVTSRHVDGEMAAMGYADYAAMVEESPLSTYVAEYRDAKGKLAAACLTDRLSDGLSAVYSYFAPDLPQRSLGTFMVLHLIQRCREMGLPYLYLGYWIRGGRKMSYKTRFQPLEALGPDGWSPLVATAPAAAAE